MHPGAPGRPPIMPEIHGVSRLDDFPGALRLSPVADVLCSKTWKIFDLWVNARE